MEKKLLTLCLVLRGGKVLLGMKKRGFGEGRWNGFGGKVEKGETIEEAARRELKEEAGILAKKMKKQGVLRFTFEDSPKELLEVHVFSVSSFEGRPAESGEMRPKWFKVGQIPFAKMWPDDKIWLPLLLKKKRFEGSFHFLDNDFLLSHTLFEFSEA